MEKKEKTAAEERQPWSRREFIKGMGAAGLLSVYPGWPGLKAGGPAPAALLWGDIYTKHDTGEFAYENAGRLRAIWEGLEESGLMRRLRRIESRRAAVDRVGLWGREKKPKTGAGPFCVFGTTLNARGGH